MSSNTYRRKCGIKIKPDTTNSTDLCGGCFEEKIKRLVIGAISDIEKKFNTTIWAEWVNNSDKEPKKVYRNH